MARKIVFIKPEAGIKPAIRMEFKGPTLNDYFSLRKIAQEDFGVKQTVLARKIICEWLKHYRGAVRDGDMKTVRQLALALELGNNKLNGAGVTRKEAAK